jgi:hypothetical protein
MLIYNTLKREQGNPAKPAENGLMQLSLADQEEN